MVAAAIAASAAAGLGGSLISGGAAKSAAAQQSEAADKAIALQSQIFQQTQNNLYPYTELGRQALFPYANFAAGLSQYLPQPYGYQPPPGQVPSPTTTAGGLQTFDSRAPAPFAPPSATDAITAPGGKDVSAITTPANALVSPITTSQTGQFAPITGANAGAINPVTTNRTAPSAFNYGAWGLGADQQAALENTPGYQFTLKQGLRGVQNAAAAAGRGVSGNALAGAADYSSGLAAKTFNDQLNNALAAQGQGFTQTLTGQGQTFAQRLQAIQEGLVGQQQAFGQGITSGTQALTAQQQAYGQNLTSAQQRLQNELQAFNQKLATGQFGLSEEQQAYAQRYGNVGQTAGLQQQYYGQELQGSEFDRAAQAQAFDQALRQQQQAYAQGLTGYGAGITGYGAGLTGQQQGYAQALGNLLAPGQAYLPLIQTGANAAAGQGTIGTAQGTSLGNILTSQGAANAAGTVGAANALTGGFNNIGNMLLLNNLLNPSGGGTTPAFPLNSI